MSFHRGRVTWCKYFLSGDGPKTVDDTLLAILADHGFRETEVGAPDEVEAGFVTGDHLFDAQFTYEKCGFGPGSNLVLFAMRIDTHKVPPEVKHAYRKQNELAAASQNPSGFASKAQKRDARDAAERQLHDDLAAGKFRNSRMVALLWDLSARVIYCGSSAQTAQEQLARLMRDGFGLELQYASAGISAAHHLRSVGRGRDYEDLQPTPFTPPPPEIGDVENATFPVVPWVAKSVDLKDFLGNEFLLWLWWKTEENEGEIPVAGNNCFVVIDKTLDMDCAWDALGKMSLRGNGPARFAEAGEALATGKWPRKIGLVLSDGEFQWELTLQGDRMAVSGVKLPSIDAVNSDRELIEARLLHVQTLARLLDGLYAAFLADRTGAPWPTMRTTVRQWIAARRPRHAPEPVSV